MPPDCLVKRGDAVIAEQRSLDETAVFFHDCQDERARNNLWKTPLQ